ncbi:hypothetical protein, partial [Pseudomonas sp. 2822-17]|uniref:hypothetical protein n=1 Tax=Pseudomonas sp. 2822-17 TaxID=1712678 RepID=UPI000C61C0CE
FQEVEYRSFQLGDLFDDHIGKPLEQVQEMISRDEYVDQFHAEVRQGFRQNDIRRHQEEDQVYFISENDIPYIWEHL